MIRVEQVKKSFGAVQAVRDVSFELAPGQVTGLLGPNGAGKSTTIRMIVGFFMPDEGRVLIDGIDTLANASAARSRIGYLPESAPLYPEMKVAEYLDFRGRLFCMPRTSRVAAIEKVIDRCRLGEMRRRRLAHLSKGYRQRVGLAAALLHDPPVLVLDEPTNGLDPGQIRETRELIRELSADKTTLVSSHILPEVEALCGRVIVIAGGKVRADGAIEELGRSAGERAVYVVQARLSRTNDEERFLKIMHNLPFVGEVSRAPEGRREGEWVEWCIWPKPGAPDLREAIATGAINAGFLLRELRSQSPSLERLFHSLVEQSTPAGGGAAA